MRRRFVGTASMPSAKGPICRTKQVYDGKGMSRGCMDLPHWEVAPVRATRTTTLPYKIRANGSVSFVRLPSLPS